MHKTICGDALTVLRQMHDNCVHCVVTSPPYFGLRDYGTATWEGGDADCLHRAPDEAGSTTKPTAGQREHAGRFAGSHCHSCGAKRIDNQIGLEQAPAEYVAKLVEVFREVRRVLRPDGTCWLNLGDSYVANRGNSPDKPGHDNKAVHSSLAIRDFKIPGKPKDLIGIPWRVAFALQADGWYLRQDIIWAKPNPMPESVRDRCTKAHEYLFMLTKSEKYAYDAAAIEEPRTSNESRPSFRGGAYVNNATFDNSAGGVSTDVGNVKFDKQAGHGRRHAGFNARWDATEVHGSVKTTRNKRSVWTIAPKPYKEAHFATFPPDLVEPCIKAGSPENGIVLDPFGGAGTTGLVAKNLNRHCVLIELNPDYVKLIEKRLL